MLACAWFTDHNNDHPTFITITMFPNSPPPLFFFLSVQPRDKTPELSRIALSDPLGVVGAGLVRRLCWLRRRGLPCDVVRRLTLLSTALSQHGRSTRRTTTALWCWWASLGGGTTRSAALTLKNSIRYVGCVCRVPCAVCVLTCCYA